MYLSLSSFLLLFLAFLVAYGPESAPFTWSPCIPSPVVALLGVKVQGAFTAKFYDPTAMLIPTGEGSRQRTEDTVGGGTKSLCAPEVLTYRAVDHVVDVGGGYMWNISSINKMEVKPLVYLVPVAAHH